MRIGLHWAMCIALIALTVFLAGCGGGGPSMSSSTEAQLPAELRSGDVTIRATTLPTLRLNDAMAREYGVQRDADTVLLVVGLRRGASAQEISVEGTVRASARNLLGHQQKIALREIRSGGGGSGTAADYVDYVGTAAVSVPDTLHFQIDAVPKGAASATLRFNRDFFP